MSAVTDTTAKLGFGKRLWHAAKDETKKSAYHGMMRRGYVGRIAGRTFFHDTHTGASKKGARKPKATSDVSGHIHADNLTQGLAQSTALMGEAFSRANHDINAANKSLGDSAESFGDEIQRAARTLRDVLTYAVPSRARSTTQTSQPVTGSSKKPQAASTTSISKGLFMALAGFKGKGMILGAARILGPVIAGLASGISEYMSTGSILRGSIVGGSALGGAALGAAIGTAIMPIVGTALGWVAGLALGAGGAWVGDKLAQTGLDYFGVGKSSPTSNTPSRTHFEATEIKFDVKDEITFTNRLGGDDESGAPGASPQPKNLNFMERAFKNLGLPNVRDMIPPGVRKALGVDTAGNPTPSASPESSNVSTNGKPVPADVLAKAEALLQGGGSSQQLQNFMAEQGYPMRGNWCGEFTAAIVKSTGATPPKDPAIATNWMKGGEHVDPKDVQPGDIAVIHRGHAPGQMGGHVGIVKNINNDKGTMDLIAGNQGRPVWNGRSTQGVEFRRYSAPTPQAPPAPEPMPAVSAPEQAPKSSAGELTPPDSTPATSAPTKQSMMPGTAKAPKNDREVTQPEEERPFQGSFLDLVGAGNTPWGGF